MFIDLLDWSIGEKWKLCLSTTVSYILMALLKGGKGCAEFIGAYFTIYLSIWSKVFFKGNRWRQLETLLLFLLVYGGAVFVWLWVRHSAIYTGGMFKIVKKEDGVQVSWL